MLIHYYGRSRGCDGNFSSLSGTSEGNRSLELAIFSLARARHDKAVPGPSPIGLGWHDPDNFKGPDKNINILFFKKTIYIKIKITF